MATFSYDELIPASANDPSDDQPIMQVNAASIKSIWAVDHETFDATEAGSHKRVFLTSKASPNSPVGNQSLIYSADGGATTSAQLLFRNPDCDILASATRAFARVTLTYSGSNVSGATILNGYNVVGFDSGGVREVTLSLTPDCVTGTNAAVIVSNSAATTPSAFFSGVMSAQDKVTIRASALTPTQLSFMILQF